MPRVALTKTSPTSIGSNGTNLTDLTPTVMVSGSDNGVTFVYDANDDIILVNDTGGSAVYTLVLPTLSVESIGASITDPTITVADGKTHILRNLPASVKQSNNLVYIDCSVAGKIAVLQRD